LNCDLIVRKTLEFFANHHLLISWFLSLSLCSSFRSG